MEREFRICAENLQALIKKLQEENDNKNKNFEEKFKIKAISMLNTFYEHRKEIETTIKQIISGKDQVSI